MLECSVEVLVYYTTFLIILNNHSPILVSMDNWVSLKSDQNKFNQFKTARCPKKTQTKYTNKSQKWQKKTFILLLASVDFIEREQEKQQKLVLKWTVTLLNILNILLINTIITNKYILGRFFLVFLSFPFGIYNIYFWINYVSNLDFYILNEKSNFIFQVISNIEKYDEFFRSIILTNVDTYIYFCRKIFSYFYMWFSSIISTSGTSTLSHFSASIISWLLGIHFIYQYLLINNHLHIYLEDYETLVINFLSLCIYHNRFTHFQINLCWFNEYMLSLDWKYLIKNDVCLIHLNSSYNDCKLWNPVRNTWCF